MTIETFLISAGHYLLYAIGFILLFIFIVLALAFIFTFFIKAGFEFSTQIRNSKVKKRFLFYLKIPFHRFIISETDDDLSDTALDFSSMDDSADENDADSDKFVCRVTVKDEKITAEIIKPKIYGNGYEVIIHSDDIKNSADENLIRSDVENESNAELDTGPDAEPDAELDTEPDAEPDAESDAEPDAESDAEPDAESDAELDAESDAESEYAEFESESDETDFDGFDFTDFSDLYDLYNFSYSEVFEELVKYVDLSDPSQFASDTISAASKVSKSTSRLLIDILLRSNVQMLSLNAVYGLSDPADTAVSYGTVQSFNASCYAYLFEVQKKSHSFFKRKRAKQISAHLKNDILIIPNLTQKELKADADVSFSIWVPYLYFPTLRFLLTKNTRWFVRRYVYKYYIRQYLKTKKAERKERKEEKKSKKRESETS